MSESEIKTMVKIVGRQPLDLDRELPALRALAEHNGHIE